MEAKLLYWGKSELHVDFGKGKGKLNLIFKERFQLQETSIILCWKIMSLSQLPSGEITEQHKPFTLTFTPKVNLESPVHPKCIVLDPEASFLGPKDWRHANFTQKRPGTWGPSCFEAKKLNGKKLWNVYLLSYSLWQLYNSYIIKVVQLKNNISFHSVEKYQLHHWVNVAMLRLCLKYNLRHFFKTCFS